MSEPARVGRGAAGEVGAAPGSREGLPAPLNVTILLGGIFALIVALVLVSRRNPAAPAGDPGLPDFGLTIGSLERIMLLLCAACFALGMFSRGFRRPRSGRGRRALGAVIALLCVSCGFFYFFAHRGVVLRSFVQDWDQFHYFLGPKYFRELGYTGLYEAALVAMGENALEGRSRAPAVRDVMDLRTNRFMTAGEALRGNTWKERFNAPRWREFRGDVAFFTDSYGDRAGKYLSDHGYNGTPVLTAFSSSLARLFPVTGQGLAAAALIDIALLFGTFALVARCFGWRIGVLFFLFYCLNLPNRFFTVGGSFLRYGYLAALVAGLCMLKVRRHAAAGALLALSSLLNVFPVVFVAGVAARAGWGIVGERRLPPEYRRFFVSFALSVVLLAAGSHVVLRGAGGWGEFAGQMKLESTRLTPMRIGFPYVLMLERSADTLEAKQAAWKNLKAVAYAAPLLALLLAAFLSKGLDDAGAAALVGVLGIYLSFSLVCYYYAVLATLVLVWDGRLDRRPGLWGVMLPFALMAVANYGFIASGYSTAFVFNKLLSVLVGLYLAGVLACLAWTGRAQPPPDVVPGTQS